MIIIDRFDGDDAVLEADDGMLTVRRDALPDGAREGDVLTIIDGRYSVDAIATEQRREAIARKRRALGLG